MTSKPMLLGFCSPCMGSGKTTVAQELAANHGFTIVRFAGTLKAMAVTLFTQAGLSYEMAEQLISDPELKESPLPLLGGKSPRQLMQTLGGDWGRDLISSTLWVDITMNKVRALLANGHNVVLDDMRYPNEADAVVAAGGKIVRIIRPEAQLTVAHQSEGQLDDYPVAFELLNDGGFEGVPLRTSVLVDCLTN